jgi:adenylosuccinate synthase
VKFEGRLLVSDRAHLLFDLHKEVDGLREAELAGGWQRMPCQQLHTPPLCPHC